MNKDSLGDRMKENYENRYRFFLTRRTPVIIRIDGKAFHTFTRRFKRPFDYIMAATMRDTAQYLCVNIMGCQFGYTQSDEISLLLIDYKKLASQAWFDNNLQKITSVAASMATMAFNKFFKENAEAICYFKNGEYKEYIADTETYKEQYDNAMFDARAFNIPEAEVCNYFVWRQQDAIRNSIETAGHAHFSNKELHKINCTQIKEKLSQEKDINWEDYPAIFRTGSAMRRTKTVNAAPQDTNWTMDGNPPLFSKNRNYIEDLLLPEE